MNFDTCMKKNRIQQAADLKEHDMDAADAIPLDITVSKQIKEQKTYELCEVRTINIGRFYHASFVGRQYRPIFMAHKRHKMSKSVIYNYYSVNKTLTKIGRFLSSKIECFTSAEKSGRLKQFDFYAKTSNGTNKIIRFYNSFVIGTRLTDDVLARLRQAAGTDETDGHTHRQCIPQPHHCCITSL